MQECIYQKVMCFVLAMLLLCSLTSCMLLPDEKTTRKVSHVSMDKLTDYKTISPVRKDVEVTQEFSCVYKQLKEEELSFKLNDIRVSEVNVSVGAKVKKGDLLASLQIQDLDEEIHSLEAAIKLSKEIIKQLKYKADYDKEIIEIDYKYGNITQAERKRSIAEIDVNLEGDLKAKENEVYIQNLRMEEKKKYIEGAKIYAPCNGIVTFVAENLATSLSIKDLPIIKMIDPRECVFELIGTEDTTDLLVGQTYTVDCDSGSYKGTIALAKGEKSGTKYLKVNDQSISLTVNEKGTIHNKVESRKGILTLPMGVVREGDGFRYVYQVNEDNMKVMKKVEVGEETVQYTEIVKGLTENDLVIQEGMGGDENE